MKKADEFEKYQEFLEKKSEPENDSGKGPESVLPEELRGLNWGALFLNLAWGIPMKVPIAWLCLVPFIGFFVPFVLWVKGNEWAWRNRKWRSIEHFRKTQERWSFYGFILIGVIIVAYLMVMSWMEHMISQYLPNVPI